MQTGQRETEFHDNALWFQSLIAPKGLEATDDSVICRIGFERRVALGDDSCIVDDVVEVDGRSITEALRHARLEYEFLTS